MPLIYSKKTVLLNGVLEFVAWAVLFPVLLILNKKSACTESRVKNILLVEPFGMGDILSLSVMLDPLSARYPGARVLLFTKTGNEKIYARDARIAKTYTASIPWSKVSGQKRGSLKEWFGVFKTCREIARLRPDIALDTRSEIRSQILMVLCGCRQRIGFTNYLNTNINVKGWLLSKRVPKGVALHRYEMNRALLESGLGMELEPLRFPTFKPDLVEEGLAPSGKQVLFHIGARWRYRQWPEEKWSELGDRLKSHGYTPVLVGAPYEEKLLVKISGLCGLEYVAADIERLIRLIKGSDLLVSLDSGPMHLAQTLGTPVTALFGPGDFDLWHPQGRRDQSVFSRLPCNPCLQNECIRPNDSCMQQITVDMVYDKIIKVLEDE